MTSVRGEVLVVTGAGGMGEAIARRLGSGRAVVIADFSDAALERVAAAMHGDGYDVHPVRVDVSSGREVSMFAATVAELGSLRCLVHTAGVSPVQATSQQIIDVDVVGTARILDAFEALVEPGTVAVCIASMAGTMTTLAPDVLRLLAVTPTDELHGLPVLDPALMDPGTAYGVAKRANQMRVQAASTRWGRKGGRVVSISPGVISTPMGQAELSGPHGDVMRSMIEMSGTQRVGTPNDIAAAVEFLAGPAASFITGIDLLVDGGVIAALGTAPVGGA
jgi:NAD(P)-dependent dehydrogenase (short-subunit alcohol dehydrogenase family)